MVLGLENELRKRPKFLTLLICNNHNLNYIDPEDHTLTFCSFPAKTTNKKFSEIEKNH